MAPASRRLTNIPEATISTALHTPTIAEDSACPSPQRARRCDRRGGTSPVAAAPSRTYCVYGQGSECGFWGWGRREVWDSSTLFAVMIAHRQDIVSSTSMATSADCAALTSTATANSSPAAHEKNTFMVLEPAAHRRWRRSHRSRRKPRAALLQGRMGLAATFRRAVELSFFVHPLPLPLGPPVDARAET